jgi:hypothetical protein
MGSSRPRNSTRAIKARSVKRKRPSPCRHCNASQRPAPTGPRVPAAIEVAIDDQRCSLETVLSLLYCLHSALRRQIEDTGTVESKALEKASKSADLTDISGMLLVQLDLIHAALDPSELAQANPDPEMVKLTEAVRTMGAGSDAEELPLPADSTRDTEGRKP